MVKKILEINELKKYKDYVWKEITIGCSDTYVYKLTNNSECVFLKVGKSGLLTQEYLKLKTLKGYLNIPQIIFYYNQDIEILLTTKMLGEMSCEDEFIDVFPNETINVLCEAIRVIQAVKIDEKLKKELKSFSLDNEIELIKEKISKGEINKIPEKLIFKKFKSLTDIIDYLENNKPTGDLVFSHGDVSMPNIFIEKNKLSGFIDIGNAGIRQKWYDITDLYVSVRRNFESQEMADKFLNVLGVKNKEAIEYYEILINLS